MDSLGKDVKVASQRALSMCIADVADCMLVLFLLDIQNKMNC